MSATTGNRNETATPSNAAKFIYDFSTTLGETMRRHTSPFPRPDLPRNPFNDNFRFTGPNLLRLTAENMANPYWGSRRQIENAGGTIPEIATEVKLQRFMSTTFDGKPLEKPEMALVSYFNLGQVEGLRIPGPTRDMTRAEEFIKQANVTEVTRLTYGRYDRDKDQIQMPSPKMYINTQQYMRGVVEVMVERQDFKDNDTPLHDKKSAEYALTELKLSIATAIVCDELGIGVNTGNKSDVSHKWATMAKHRPVDIMRIANQAEALARKTLGIELTQTREAGQDQDSTMAKEPKIAEHRTYLSVPYNERTIAKSQGASFDPIRKLWYAEAGQDLNKFAAWSPNRDIAKGNYSDLRDALAARMKDNQFIVDGEHPILDGKMHRIRTMGDRPGQTSGMYHIHFDKEPVISGPLINMRTNTQINFCFKTVDLTPDQKKEIAQKAEQQKAQRPEDKEMVFDNTSRRLTERLKHVEPVTEQNPTPYHQKKQIQVYPGTYRDGNTLLVPMYDLDGKVWSISRFEENGNKGISKNSKITGCCHVVGGIEGLEKAPVLLMAEGYSTSCTTTQVAGIPTVSVGSAHNFKEVGKALKERYPGRPIAIFAENDLHLLKDPHVKKNVGKEAANEAAKQLGATVILPTFARADNAAENRLSDFNDMAVSSKLGIESVKLMIDPALKRIQKHHKEQEQDDTHKATKEKSKAKTKSNSKTKTREKGNTRLL